MLCAILLHSYPLAKNFPPVSGTMKDTNVISDARNNEVEMTANPSYGHSPAAVEDEPEYEYILPPTG